MQLYTVTLSFDIDVLADSNEDAETKALSKAPYNGYSLNVESSINLGDVNEEDYQDL